MIDKDNRLPICFRSAFCLSFGRMPAGFSLILVLLALLQGLCSGSSPLRLARHGGVSLQAAHLGYLRLPDSVRAMDSFAIADIPAESLQNATDMNFGRASSPVLLRTVLQAPQAGTWWIWSELRTPEHLRLWLDGRDLGPFGTGEPFTGRAAGTYALTIPLELDSGSHELWIYASDPHGDCQVEMHLLPASLFLRWIQGHASWSAWVIGWLSLVTIMALYLLLVVRQRAYGWYLGYVVMGLLWVCTKTGFAAAWFWPQLPELNVVAPTLFNHIALACFFLFVCTLLDMPKQLPWAGYFLRFGAMVLFAGALLGPLTLVSPQWQRAIVARLSPDIVQVPLMAGVLAAMAWRSLRGDRLALYVFLSTLPLLLGVVLVNLTEQTGLNPYPSSGDRMTILAALLENTLTTWVLVRELRLRESQRVGLEKNFHVRLLEQTDNTRRIVSRELHDNLGQRLVALRLQLSKSNGLSSAEAQDAAQEVGDLLGSVRALSHSLHPHSMEAGTLAGALQDMCRKLSVIGGLQITCETPPQPVILGAERETHLYRIAQEALQNALRHSHANCIQTKLSDTPKAVILEVADNGKGFSPHIGLSGMGFANMGARTRALDAQFKVESSPETGTYIRIEVPR